MSRLSMVRVNKICPINKCLIIFKGPLKRQSRLQQAANFASSFLFLKKIRYDISWESGRRRFSWNIMPYFLFLKKHQNLKLSSAANYRWRFMGKFCAKFLFCCHFRAKFDIIHHSVDSKRVPSQAFVSCNFCGKSIACNMTFASRSRPNMNSMLPSTHKPKVN